MSKEDEKLAETPADSALSDTLVAPPDPFDHSLEREQLLDQVLTAMFGEPREGEAARLGHYRLLGKLGQGGMGVVFAAYDTKLERKVAIKQLRRESAHDRQRLVREALAMAKLSHPNVIPIYEIGERGDSTFVVMEYVEGATLRAWLEMPRELAELLAVFKGAARGLIAAHQVRLIHRDFKPDNVMVGVDGRVRVMDFGLARASAELPEGGADDPAGEVGGSLTQTGAVVGTPAYMAPEQLRGESLSAAADQFSFCVALYEGLYGQRPFAGATFEQLLAATSGGQLRARPPDDAVPGWLREIVIRGLAPTPEQRHESMQALLDALVSGELEHDPGAREPPRHVFVAHAGVDKPAVARLCGELLDHGVRPWLDMWELAAGDDPETRARALLDAPALLLCQGRGRWEPPTPALAEALAARRTRDPATVYRVGLPDASGPPDSSTSYDLELDAASWDDGVIELARMLGVDRGRERWLEWEAERAGLASSELCPYRGLEPFREHDARWMFGREREVAELLELVAERTRFLTVIGASGSGKSSLLLAGLCPALRHGALGDGHAWEIVDLRPGRRPCAALAQALASLRPSSVAPASLAKAMRTSDDALREALEAIGGDRILLVVDQLEELFTEAAIQGSAHESADALAFVRNLCAATRPGVGYGDGLFVAASLRADFVQRSLEIGALARALERGTYFALPPMSEQQLRAAIERPARRVGFSVGAKLVEKLVAATAEQAGRLPLLQYVLRELWQRRGEAERVLAHELYAETGGLEGAIALAAEQTLAELQRELGAGAVVETRRLMTRLVHLGEASSGDTRRRVTIDELGEDGDTRRVLDTFVSEARVLVAGEADGVEVFELAHEAMLREWSTLVAWLDSDRDALRLRQELAASAAAARVHGGREYLWPKGRVEEARRVLAASMVELNEAERGFLDHSARVVQRRERRVRGAVVAFMLAALATVLVVLQKNAKITTQSEVLGQQSDQLREQMLALEAEKLAQRRSLSVQRGLRAQMLIAENDEREALILALQSLGAYAPEWLDPPPEAIEAIEHVLADDALVLHDARVLRGHRAEVRALDYCADGSRLVTASADGTLRVWGPGGDSLAILDGGGSPLEVLACSPDGARVASAGRDGIVRIWELGTSELSAALDGHERPVVAIDWAPDGAALASASHDGVVRIWDAERGEPSAKLDARGGRLTTLAWSPDGARVASAGVDGLTRVWSRETGALATTLERHADGVSSLAWSPDGARLASASWDKTARVWDPESGELITVLSGHDDRLEQLVYSPDGARIATASLDDSARIWNPETGALLTRLAGHESDVVALAFSPEGTQLATAGFDGIARIWDPTSGKMLAKLRGHGQLLYALAYAPDGASLATGGDDKSVRVWTLELDNPVAPLLGHQDILYALAYALDDTRLATASKDGTAKIWDPETGHQLASLDAHAGPVVTLAASPDGTRVATGGVDRSARIWDARSGELLMTLAGHDNVIFKLAFSPEGTRLATAGFDDTARIWDLRSGELLETLTGHRDDIGALAWSPDGARLASGSWDSTARVWDAHGGALLTTLEGHEGDVSTLCFSPDGVQVATASSDKSARVWNPVTGELVHTLVGHGDTVIALVYSPDGTRLASGSWDSSVRIWDPRTGALVQTLDGHEDSVDSLAFSPDGARLASGSLDTTARIWDPATGVLLATLEGHTGLINDLAFTRDGLRLATAGTDSTARVWDPASGELLTTLEDRIGVRQADGSIVWPIAPSTLTRIACERLLGFEDEYEAEALELCAPLLRNEERPDR